MQFGPCHQDRGDGAVAILLVDGQQTAFGEIEGHAGELRDQSALLVLGEAAWGRSLGSTGPAQGHAVVLDHPGQGVPRDGTTHECLFGDRQRIPGVHDVHALTASGLSRT